MHEVYAERPETSVDDTGITLAVERELTYDPAVTAARLNVSTMEGIVRLDGTSENILAKDRAERIAETVKGVRSVVNLIQVDPVERPSDGKTLENLEHALIMDPATDSYEVSATVEDGVVTLTRTVESWTEKNLCTRVAKGVRGVTAPSNSYRRGSRFGEDRVVKASTAAASGPLSCR